MNNWFYRETSNITTYYTSSTQFPEKCVGFIYKITNTKNGMFYIGKKILKNTNKRKIGVKERKTLIGVGRKPNKKIVITESNWADYYGSSKPLQEDINEYGVEFFDREILYFCMTKKQLNYYEVFYQFQYNVLANPKCYNMSILGKYFRADVK